MTRHREGDDHRDAEVPPRVRDLPPPREAQGVAAPALRRILAWPYRAILAGLLRLGLRPWHITLLSLATNVLVGLLLLTGRRLVPGLLLIAAGTLDVMDGAVARHRGEVRRSGAFLDSVFDRISDVILFSCLFWSLAEQGADLEAALALATLVIALFVSHIRAVAEASGVSLSEGFFQRLERYVAIIVGLVIPGALLPALVILVVLGGITVVQRGWSAVTRIAAEGGTHGG